MQPKTEGSEEKGPSVLPFINDSQKPTSPSLNDADATEAAFDNSEDALIHLMGLKSDCSLIVVDHGVPGSIKGMEFISMAHERWPGLPAILTSGYQLDASQVTLPVTYLFKPWSIDELAQAIRQALHPTNVLSTLPPLDQQGF